MKGFLQIGCFLCALLVIACTTRHTGGVAKRRHDDTPPDAGLTCPQHPARLRCPAAPAMGFARGEGPVYIGLGAARAIHYAKDTLHHRGWYYYKVLVGIAPRYRLGLSINGRESTGRGVLRWHNGAFPGSSSVSLDIAADRTGAGWRYLPGDMLIRNPGRYVIRIEGARFVERVAFRAKR